MCIYLSVCVSIDTFLLPLYDTDRTIHIRREMTIAHLSGTAELFLVIKFNY